MALTMSGVYGAARLAKLDSGIGLLKWMVGFNLAVTVAVLAKLLV